MLCRPPSSEPTPGEPPEGQLDGGEGNEGGQGFHKVYEVLGETPVASEPGESALDNPAARQDDEAEAELTRRRGERFRDRDTSNAETSFREALEIARHQEAKLWELRAASSLARLWVETDRKDEARNLLAPIYGWFSEGFDTLDLKGAKALLDELA